MSETIVPFPKKTTLDAYQIVGEFADDSEFQKDREKGYNISRALARTALKRTGMNPSLVMEEQYEPDLSDTTPEKSLNAMIGALPAYIHGLEGIREHHETGKLRYREHQSMKRRASQLNHSIKSMIKQNTSLTFQNITDTAATLYGVMNRERWGEDRPGYEAEARWFKKQFEGDLRGMQHEVLAQQVIQAINLVNPIIDPKTGKETPRVTIDTSVSVEDDLHGTDMYVTLDGVTFPIDIKASERTAENVRKKSSHPDSIITTGFTAQELNGAFRVNTKLAKQAAPAMLDKLYAARAEYMHKHNIKPADLDLAA